MSALTAIYVDFQCPYSNRLWRCLSLTSERGGIDIRPYSLDAGVDDEGRGPWERSRPTMGLELLALGELAREAGRRVHESYVDAVFAAVHDEHRDISRADEWLSLGTEVGLDLEAYSTDSERWRAEVGLWHREAEDDFGIFGTPTLLYSDNTALFVKLDQPVREAHEAHRLLDGLAELATQPVAEVRRTA